jgi:hypothetical protein
MNDLTYKLHVPPRVPVKDFWSLVAYDPANRSQLQTGQPYPTVGSQHDPVMNADGSVDVFFSSRKPKGVSDKNWIQTDSKRGFFVYYRFYGPLKAYTDKTWKPDDLVLVK